MQDPMAQKRIGLRKAATLLQRLGICKAVRDLGRINAPNCYRFGHRDSVTKRWSWDISELIEIARTRRSASESEISRILVEYDNWQESPPRPQQNRTEGGKERIPGRDQKIEAIVNTISTRIGEFSSLYRGGPSLYFYRRVLELRKSHPRIADLLSDCYCLEMLYATLVSWDMNSRRAKLRYFDAFRASLESCLPELEAIEDTAKLSGPYEDAEMLSLLEKAFLKMELMETAGRLVSNSKCLHFLFPALFMPMDGTNTLQYLFGNTSESASRYLDAIKLSFEIMRKPVPFDQYLDDCWNQSVPKLIDNAIIILSGKSTKKRKYT